MPEAKVLLATDRLQNSKPFQSMNLNNVSIMNATLEPHLAFGMCSVPASQAAMAAVKDITVASSPWSCARRVQLLRPRVTRGEQELIAISSRFSLKCIFSYKANPDLINYN